MNPCPQCGSTPQATDKFCNICGTPVAAAAPAAAPAQAPAGNYGAPPAPQAAYGAPAGAYAPPPAPQSAPRCQLGHDIPPGASYCAMGHPLALDAMPIANAGYAAPQGYAPPAPAAPAFGQPAPSPYGAPAPAAYDPNAYAQPQGYAAPQPAPSPYGAPAQPQQPQGYAPPGADPYAQQPNPYGAQPQAFGAPAPHAPAYGGGPAVAGAGSPMQDPAYAAAMAYAGSPGPSAPPAPAAAPGAAPSGIEPVVIPVNGLRAFLVAYQAVKTGEYWPLEGGSRKMLGRAGADAVDIALKDPTTSSKHAVLSVDGSTGAVLLEDVGSTNGTFVNEEHIGFNGKREVQDGDKIRFGGFTTIIKIVRA